MYDLDSMVKFVYDLDVDIFYESLFVRWYQWPQLLFYVFALALLIFIYRFFNNGDCRNQKILQPRSWSIDTESYKAKLEQFSWINKLVFWLLSNSSNKLPSAIETWLHDLNMTISTKLTKFSLLIYGLKDESSLPSLVEFRSLKTVGHEIHADVLLSSTQFGFLVAIQENNFEPSKSASVNYSAVIAKFECWCSAVLTRLHGDVGLIIKPIEKTPECQFKIKAMSKNNASNVNPEIIARVLRDAITETTFYANLTLLTSRKNTTIEINPVQQNNCYGDGSKSDRLIGNKSLSIPLRKQPNNITPVQGYHQTKLNIGRVSTKKCLIINNFMFKPKEELEYFPLFCEVRLEHLHQQKTRYLQSSNFATSLNFEIASKPTTFTVQLHNSPDSIDALDCRGSAVIDPMSIRTMTQLVIPMKNGGNVGQIVMIVSIANKSLDRVANFVSPSQPNSTVKIKKKSTTDKMKKASRKSNLVSKKAKSQKASKRSVEGNQVYGRQPPLRRSSSCIETPQSLKPHLLFNHKHLPTVGIGSSPTKPRRFFQSTPNHTPFISQSHKQDKQKPSASDKTNIRSETFTSVQTRDFSQDRKNNVELQKPRNTYHIISKKLETKDYLPHNPDTPTLARVRSITSPIAPYTRHAKQPSLHFPKPSQTALHSSPELISLVSSVTPLHSSPEQFFVSPDPTSLIGANSRTNDFVDDLLDCDKTFSRTKNKSSKLRPATKSPSPSSRFHSTLNKRKSSNIEGSLNRSKEKSDRDKRRSSSSKDQLISDPGLKQKKKSSASFSSSPKKEGGAINKLLTRFNRSRKLDQQPRQPQVIPKSRETLAPEIRRSDPIDTRRIRKRVKSKIEAKKKKSE